MCIRAPEAFGRARPAQGDDESKAEEVRTRADIHVSSIYARLMY